MAKDKKSLSKSEIGHDIGMDDSSRLVKVFIQPAEKISYARQSYFPVFNSNILPDVGGLLDLIVREV